MFEICQLSTLCDIIESIHCYISGDLDYELRFNRVIMSGTWFRGFVYLIT